MKPAKKHTDGSKNRQQTNENNSTSKIKAYFKSAEKSFVIEGVGGAGEKVKTDTVKDFYVKALKEKLKGLKDVNGTEGKDSSHQVNAASADFEEDTANVDVTTDENRIDPVATSTGECSECQKKAAESKEWEEKYKKLKKSYMKLSIDHSDISMKYKDLVKVATGKIQATNDGAEAKANDDVFTPNELKFLQYMSLEKKKDSNFVLQCLHFAYKSDHSVLAHKSLIGTTEKIEFTDGGDQIIQAAKGPLSPNKVIRIKELFLERVSKSDENAVDHGERIKDSYINKLFASGIKNIAKRKLK